MYFIEIAWTHNRCHEFDQLESFYNKTAAPSRVVVECMVLFPSVTLTSCVPFAKYGTIVPVNFLPSTRMESTPLLTWLGFSTVMRYVAPRTRRVTVYPLHSEGMQGDISNPAYVGLTPMMYRVAA